MDFLIINISNFYSDGVMSEVYNLFLNKAAI